MTPEKVLEVIDRYEKFLAPKKLEPKRLTGKGVIYKERIGHLLYMCAEIRKFVAEGRMEKAFRWLGFIQGALWSDAHFTVEELALHNKPAEA
ncbi:hypothetical protein [Hyphomicrobium sp.]|uniref:hypothetical protein n=1 Tax=Hyphomicrobium sp. TaxID=82 RepID=UPI001D9BDAD5|nr:hypothetical protein [Hyphomicrobium sp.]MBY0559889.1 hypothetical protein [Hyphomicrobium sp.]